MHQFEVELKKPKKVCKDLVELLVPKTLEGSFIFSFYDVPVEYWAKLSQLDFACEIIVDLKDNFALHKIPKTLKGIHVKNDKLVLSYPFEFEQVLRAELHIEDVAIIIDGDLTDHKRVAHGLKVLNFLGDHLNQLSDYTFTFWINQFKEQFSPPAGKGGTFAIDLDGITPVLMVEIADDRTHLLELSKEYLLLKELEKKLGHPMKLSRHAKAMMHQLQAEGKA